MQQMPLTGWILNPGRERAVNQDPPQGNPAKKRWPAGLSSSSAAPSSTHFHRQLTSRGRPGGGDPAHLFFGCPLLSSLLLKKALWRAAGRNTLIFLIIYSPISCNFILSSFSVSLTSPVRRLRGRRAVSDAVKSLQGTGDSCGITCAGTGRGRTFQITAATIPQRPEEQGSPTCSVGAGGHLPGPPTLTSKRGFSAMWISDLPVA